MAMAVWNRGAGDFEPAVKRYRPPADIVPSAIKLLVSPSEAACIYGDNGAAMEEIQAASGANLGFSGDGNHYPGTDLQEVIVQSTSSGSVLDAAIHALQKVLEGMTHLNTGDADVLPPMCRVLAVIPARAARQVIGLQARQETGMQISIDSNFIPPGPPSDLSEQVVRLDGPISGLHLAMMSVLVHLVPLAREPWFASWAVTSNCGLVIEGLALFQDLKPKKGVAVKLLVSPTEASVILGRGGERIHAISQATGAALQMGQREKLYPGTQLQELKVLGFVDEVVLACQYAFGQIQEHCGCICCGEEDTEKGFARVRMVIPTPVAWKMGRGSEVKRKIRESTGLHTHVDPTIIPPGPQANFTEQVVCFHGPVSGAASMLSQMSESISAFSAEHWFESWANNSNCGTIVPDLVLDLDKNVPIPTPEEIERQEREADLTAMVDAAAQELTLKQAAAAAQQTIETAQQNAEVSDASKAASAGSVDKGGGKTGGPLSTSGAANAPPPGAHCACAMAAAAANPTSAESAAKLGGNQPQQGDLFMAVKVLVSPREAEILLGQDGSTLGGIQTTTNTTMKLSEGIYPGCTLREITVTGMSKEAVLLAIIYVLTVCIELLGCMMSGEDDVEAGGARLKMVVPAHVAASIIGVGGASVKQICHLCAVRVQVDQVPVACTRGMSEQAVLLSGTAGQVQSALPLVFEHVALIAAEKDLTEWASHSNAGVSIPGFTLFSGKGKGKGKGKKSW